MGRTIKNRLEVTGMACRVAQNQIPDQEASGCRVGLPCPQSGSCQDQRLQLVIPEPPCPWGDLSQLNGCPVGCFPTPARPGHIETPLETPLSRTEQHQSPLQASAPRRNAERAIGSLLPNLAQEHPQVRIKNKTKKEGLFVLI